MRIEIVGLAFVLVCLSWGANAAHADTIKQPASASTNMGASCPVNALRNKSGLAVGYTDGVTDFDVYIASNPTHDSASQCTFIWASTSGTTTGFVDFNLGGTFVVQSMALWNRGGNNGDNVIGFKLFSDDNPSFTSPTNLGTFTANPNTGPPNAVLPEVFTFFPTSDSYIRMEITSNISGPFTVAGEVIFEAGVLPEGIPTVGEWGLITMGVLLACGLGIIVYRMPPIPGAAAA